MVGFNSRTLLRESNKEWCGGVKRGRWLNVTNLCVVGQFPLFPFENDVFLLLFFFRNHVFFCLSCSPFFFLVQMTKEMKFPSEGRGEVSLVFLFFFFVLFPLYNIFHSSIVRWEKRRIESGRMT